MLTVDEIEQIRRAYDCDQKSVRAVAREQHHHRRVAPAPPAGLIAASPVSGAHSGTE